MFAKLEEQYKLFTIQAGYEEDPSAISKPLETNLGTALQNHPDPPSAFEKSMKVFNRTFSRIQEIKKFSFTRPTTSDHEQLRVFYAEITSLLTKWLETGKTITTAQELDEFLNAVGESFGIS